MDSATGSTPNAVRVEADSWLPTDGKSERIALISVAAVSAVVSSVLAVATYAGWLGLSGGGGLIPGLSTGSEYLIFAGVFGCLTFRLLRDATRVSADGICLRGTLQTRVVPLAEVAKFEPRWSSGTFGNRVDAVLVLRPSPHASRELSLWVGPGTRLGIRKRSAGGFAVMSRRTWGEDEARRRKAFGEMQSACDQLTALVSSLKGGQALAPERALAASAEGATVENDAE